MRTRRGLAALALGWAFGLLPFHPFHPSANAAPPSEDSGLASRARLGVSSAPTIDEATVWPDGLHVLTYQQSSAASAEDSVRLWELSTGREVRRFACPPEVSTEFKGSSQDGRKLFIACAGVTQMWDVATGRMRLSLGNVLKVAVSRDARWVLTSHPDNSARLWDVATGKAVRSLVGHTAAISSLRFSPDARIAMTASFDDGTTRLWDTSTGRALPPFEDRYPVTTVDGKWLAINSPRGVRLFDMATANEVGQFAGSAGQVSPDGKQILTRDDSSASLWEVATRTKVRQFDGPEGQLSPDGSRVLTRDRDRSIRLWDSASGRELARIVGKREVRFTPDGSRLMSDVGDATVVCDSATGRELGRVAGNNSRFTPDGKQVLDWDHGAARLLDVSTGREVQRFEAHAGGVSSVAFSPDGRQVLTGSLANHAALWDLATGREVMRLVGHASAVVSAAFSPDGKQVLTGSNDQTARLWDAATGRELMRFSDTGSPLKSVAFSPDGSQVLTVGRGKLPNSVWLWDVATGRKVRRFDGDRAVFSPDGQRLLTGEEGGGIRLWNLASGQEQTRFSGESTFQNSGGVHAVAFSPDGQRVLAGRSGATVLWDATTGRQLGRYGNGADWVQAVAFSPDGKQVLNGLYSGLARLWDLATGKELRSFEGHAGSITSVAFSPRGDTVFTGGLDGSTRLWRTDTGEELAELFSFTDGTSAVIDRQGHFDAPNGGQSTHLYWIVGIETIGLDQLKERYFEPGLLGKKLGLGSEPLRDVASLTDVAMFPLVDIVKRPTRADPLLRVLVKNQGGGIGRVVVRVNGKEMSNDARARPEQDAHANELAIQVDMTAARKWLNPGSDNRIEVFAYNAQGYLRSRGQVVAFESADAGPASPVTLWAVVVGTSTYADDKINLRYPSKDARDIAKALELGGRALFGAERVRMTLLTSDGPEAAQPTKANLRAAFDALKQAKPGDVVVAYLAGHGVASRELYYYPTREAGSLIVEDPAVWAQRAVSSDELAQWLKESPALKQVLVLDTCAAGAAAKSLLAMRNAPSDQIRALDRMKDRAGVYVLMGAAADRVSYESNEYQQGLLTYALLKGMSGERLREGQYVDVAPLLDYVADQVPLLAKGIGGIQKPYIATPAGATAGKATASFDIGKLSSDDRRQIVLHSPRPLILAPRLQNAELIEDDLLLEPRLRSRLRETSYAGARGQPAPVVYVEADEMAGAIQLSGQYTVQAANVRIRLLLRRGDSRATLQVECARAALDACAQTLEQQIVKAAAVLP